MSPCTPELNSCTGLLTDTPGFLFFYVVFPGDRLYSRTTVVVVSRDYLIVYSTKFWFTLGSCGAVVSCNIKHKALQL